MIPAKIIEISDKVVVEYERTIIVQFSWLAKDRIKKKYIAEVENIKVEEILPAEWDFMKVGLRVFIELTENGKCKIVKI